MTICFNKMSKRNGAVALHEDQFQIPQQHATSAALRSGSMMPMSFSISRLKFPALIAGLLLSPLGHGAEPSHHGNAAPHPVVKELMVKDLPDIAGKDAVMLSVEYPPGGADPVHRHDADAFVYVLEGSIVMQVKDGPEVTLGPGQTFYEGPNDIHTIGRNASKTKPAKFVVVLVKNKGAPALIPAK